MGHTTLSSQRITADPEEEKLKVFRNKAECIAGGIIRMLFKWIEDGALTPKRRNGGACQLIAVRYDDPI